jgi:drug/metabolite transporter (DMT)-like permease
MLWLFYALICAFSWATVDALSKRGLAGENELVVAWVRVGYAVPFLLLTWPYIEVPPLDTTFWLATAVALPCDIIALLLYIRALKISPMSLTIPFLALTPIFVPLTSFLILGEAPSNLGLTSILLIVAGIYLLNVHTSKQGLWQPLRAIAHERGSLLMIAVALIYSLSSTMGKLAITHSEPVFFGLFYFTLLGIAFSLVVFPRLGRNSRQIFSQPKLFLAIGFFNALMILTHFLAMDLTQVAYMIAVKRTNILFSVVYGYFMFGEQNIGERALGSVLMLLGVLLIAFA